MSQIPINNNPTPPKRGERVLARDIAELWQSVKRLAARQDQMPPKVFFYPAPSSPCPFGELITVDGDRYIRGGVVYGGDNNWNVADYFINLAVDSDNLIWLEVGITANTEDSVLMPNLESSTEPTWESGSVAGGYPSNTAPNITTGVGTRIVPIGQLTVVDGVATLDPVGCGNITLGFCPPNNLSITRA